MPSAYRESGGRSTPGGTRWGGRCAGEASPDGHGHHPHVCRAGPLCFLQDPLSSSCPSPLGPPGPSALEMDLEAGTLITDNGGK